jgi:hypothetical protein
MRKVMITLAGMAVLAVVLYFTGFAGGFAEGFVTSRDAVLEHHAGLPTCESQHGQDDAKRASNDSPLAKQTGVAIVLMSDVKKVSISTDKVECSATAFLNDGKKGTMAYSFEKVASLASGQYYIHSKVTYDPE